MFSLRSIVFDGEPILLVCHGEDDHGWQFLDGSDNLKITDGVLATLGDMLQRDPSLAEVADLPLGWIAWRDAPGEPWQRDVNDEDDDDEPEAGGEG